jgi:hypothetical protein
MRQIFRPAIGLMSRLTDPQTFAIICLLVVLPLAASLALPNRGYSHRFRCNSCNSSRVVNSNIAETAPFRLAGDVF